MYSWLKISREDRRCGTLAVQEEMKKRKIRENEIVEETEVEKTFLRTGIEPRTSVSISKHSIPSVIKATLIVPVPFASVL